MTVLIFLVAGAISVTLLVLELHKHRQRTRAACTDDDLPPAA